jgi:hypothetical protein
LKHSLIRRRLETRHPTQLNTLVDFWSINFGSRKVASPFLYTQEVMKMKTRYRDHTDFVPG